MVRGFSSSTIDVTISTYSYSNITREYIEVENSLFGKSTLDDTLILSEVGLGDTHVEVCFSICAHSLQ